MFTKIVVALDGSSRAERAIPWARLIGPEAQMTLLRVVDRAAEDDVAAMVMTQEAEAYISRAQKEFAPHARTVARVGHAGPTILDMVEEAEADLVALTTHGLTSPSVFSLGVVTEKLLHGSETPLLIVPTQAPAPARVQAKKIVVPLDGSAMAEMILPVAAGVARACGAELVLAHALPEGLPAGVSNYELRLAMALEERRKQLEHRLEGRVKGLRDSEVNASLVITRGPVVDMLLEIARKEGADLFVMSAHGQGSMQRLLLGGVASKLVRRSAIPILLAKQAAMERLAARA